MQAVKLNNLFIRSIAVVTEKNIRIYYTKAPVIIFGLLFPLFIFLAFYLGREVDLRSFFPGLLAMSLFFTASSVGPLITPWEKQAGTYERLLSFPVSVNTIILGDIAAGMIFGLTINMVVLVTGLVFFNYAAHFVTLVLAMIVASFCFSSLGVLLASPSVRSPSHIMMFSSLIRFPLIFISGVLIPLEKLTGAGRFLAYFSPVTYLVDLFNSALVQKSYLPVPLSWSILIVFGLIFLFLSRKLHQRNLLKGL
ncbi:MAG: ABC transporter [Coxiella sp. DG_40]|nr:MAG: ABC transporter [Coxiella sp. DG_40]